MRFDNPTPLRIGMVGEFFGKRYRVAGRVVLGMEEKGRTFFWNEFNLVNTENEVLDLVFEITEEGAEWRLFTLFEPEPPLTAPEAATKRVGDHLKLGDSNAVVTTVSESRIYHIEGVPAEGEDLGDVAQYFNAKGGNTKIVVSWTGDEVECCRGMDVPAATIKAAFKIQGEVPGRSLFGPPIATRPRKSHLVLAILLGVGALFAFYITWQQSGTPVPIVKTPAPASALKVGDSGSLDGHSWEVREHVVAEIAQVGRISQQHEYQMVDDTGNKALLIYGLNPEKQDWYLFIPVESSAALTPEQAAAKTAGQALNVDGSDARINRLFQRVIRQSEGVEGGQQQKGGYGFTAQSTDSLLLAEWDQDQIAFYRGKIVLSKEVAAGFRF